MPPLINFKICDNSADCNGLVTCPAGVFVWDDKATTLKLDLDKCIECGACDGCCSVDAIRYAKSDKEYKAIQKEIENDTRTVADLFVDRYGASSIIDTYTFETSVEKVNNRINSNRPVIIEFNSESTIECLLKSVHIEFIQNAFHKDATYSKFFVTDTQKELFNITDTPCLRFYYKNKLLGKIDGYFTNDEKYSYLEKIKEFGERIS